MTTKLSTWLSLSTREEKEALAQSVGVSVNSLYQIAGYPHYGHQANPLVARRIETFANAIRNAHPELPELNRKDIAPACAGCEYVAVCQKSKKD